MIPNDTVRRLSLLGWDAACWSVSVAVLIGLRLSFQVTNAQWRAVISYLALSWVLLALVGLISKFYRGRFLVGSFDEAVGLAVHFAGVAAITVVTAPAINPALPRSLPVFAPPLALLGAAAGRLLYRALRERQRPGDAVSGRNALIYGAGDAGRQVLGLARSDPGLKLKVVGFVDDDLGKRNLRIHGVPVMGSGNDLKKLACELEVSVVILAIPHAPGALVERVQGAADAADLEVFVLPRLGEGAGGRVKSVDIRRVEIADVLGRRQIDTDASSIAGYVTGKRVLITGAGGSIGSELARQLQRFGPLETLMLDRDESGLHAVQLSIAGHGLLDSPETLLADIRDKESMRAIFQEQPPEIVFHAAALKHLPMLERFPHEGWKTNVLGTLNLLELSEEFGVERFVNISTDKAADATSILGSTKRVAEQLTAWHAAKTGKPYMSVRFGNVLGSRGSMLHTFNAQIAAGGPVTVTHPDVTRYFMTIPEACQLVIQAGAMGKDGEVMALEMGEPVRILDVAKRMISISGASGIDIVFTGLRSGEKMHEVLFSESEQARETRHPLVRSVQASSLNPTELSDVADAIAGS